MNSNSSSYTPGYGRCKIGVVLYGLALFVFGLNLIWTPLCLLVTGQRVTAEATTVIKVKEGLPDLILSDDLAVQGKLEPRDRSYTFWNAFRFHTPDGRAIEVRASVGSQLKPLYSLLDADGLPTTDLVYYNPKDPQSFVFPLIVSTWFAPGVLILAGLLCTMIGSVLYYWSNKPIELPRFPKPDQVSPSKV